MRHLFIINPKAGKKPDPDGLRRCIDAAMAGREYSVCVTTAPGDGEAAARREAEKPGELRVYACGGDGTLTEVLNGVAGHPNAALTVVPCGTGNDFVKIFGDADFRNIAALADGEERTLDLMETGGRYAIDICSVGFDARVARDVHKFSKLPLVTSFGAFTISAIYNLFKGLCNEYKVTVDEETLDGTYALICVANGRYYGGGYMPMADANPTDGVLDVLLVGQVSRVRVPVLLAKYKAGRYAELGGLAVRRAAREVRFDFCGRRGVINADGEMIPAEAGTVRLSDVRQRFFAPAGAWAEIDKLKLERNASIFEQTRA